MTEPKRGRGRPRSDNPLSSAVLVRLTVEQRKAVQRAADAAGITLTGWTRAAILSRLKRASS